MPDFASIVLPMVKLTLRESGTDFDDEIKSYIVACTEDLQDAGILSSFFRASSPINSRILQAIRYYCLSNYGLYNTDSEKYDKAYRSLKATLASQRKYTEE